MGDNDNPFVELSDKSGKPIVILELGDDGPMLAFADKEQHPRMALNVDNTGPSITLHDERSQQPRASFELSDQSGPAVRMWDSSSNVRAAIGVTKDGYRRNHYKLRWIRSGEGKRGYASQSTSYRNPGHSTGW